VSDSIEIIPDRPLEEGVKAGKKLGQKRIQQGIGSLLKDKHLKDSLGAMSRGNLAAYVKARLEAPPDTHRYPELEDIYPERVDFLRGLARGAECSLIDAAVHDYVTYRQMIEYWYWAYQLQRGPGHCTGVVLIGPDGVLGAHGAETAPAVPRPKGYHHRPPKPYAGLRQSPTKHPKLVLRKPRTGYIQGWGTTNEKGVGGCAGTSCSTWLDEPIEDTWPIKDVPLLRFAASIEHLPVLFRRYCLFNWGRGSSIFADTSGNAAVFERSYRRVGVRMLEGSVLWCTEGHFETPEMQSYLREKRLAYVEKAGKHLGAEDLRYAADCGVRFTHIGELCHQPWGRGYEHIRRILTDHATFPRATCRHGGPDTDPYDQSVTQVSTFVDLTHNRRLTRVWDPWKRFPCQMPEEVLQYPARP